MAVWTPVEYLDLILDEYILSDELTICSAEPSHYYHCILPDLRLPETAYILGDMVRSNSTSGFVYECIVAGITGTLEPGWGTAQDQEFTDGTVTWKTWENYALINSTIAPGDITKEDAVPSGRKIRITSRTELVHTSGTVTHFALISHTDMKIRLIQEAGTSRGEDDDVSEGLSTLINPLNVTIRSAE